MSALATAEQLERCNLLGSAEVAYDELVELLFERLMRPEQAHARRRQVLLAVELRGRDLTVIGNHGSVLVGRERLDVEVPIGDDGAAAPTHRHETRIALGGIVRPRRLDVAEVAQKQHGVVARRRRAAGGDAAATTRERGAVRRALPCARREAARRRQAVLLDGGRGRLARRRRAAAARDERMQNAVADELAGEQEHAAGAAVRLKVGETRRDAATGGEKPREARHGSQRHATLLSRRHVERRHRRREVEPRADVELDVDGRVESEADETAAATLAVMRVESAEQLVERGTEQRRVGRTRRTGAPGDEPRPHERRERVVWQRDAQLGDERDVGRRVAGEHCVDERCRERALGELRVCVCVCVRACVRVRT